MPASVGAGGDVGDEEGGGGGGRGIWAGIVRRREVLLSVAGLTVVIFTLLVSRVSATLLLITPSNESIVFPDVEASFARRISGTGIVGVLSSASPSNACMPLEAVAAKLSSYPVFVLIERGDCNFVSKVQYAQDAGYAAAIVYDNEDSHDLVTMSGNGFGIEIPAVFVSKEAGYVLSQFVNDKDVRLYMLPALETSAWSVLAVSSISLLTFSAVLSTFLFVRRQRLRRASLRLLQEPPRLSPDEIKALPIIAFDQKDAITSETCAICLEEYVTGDKLRILPCKHGFHVPCIDNWLNRKPFCPICKRDVHNNGSETNSCERTPLLSSISWQLGSNLPILVSSSASAHMISATTESASGDIC
ncbi:hypothetical protein GOP47_0019768 [Adiantum capillus-veneris]|uniref:RING-type E3 ubiquitin transferase n=1 Tax=Adiantum capillus-veneris TaxID=13818 RepID=A0A9D4UCN3_ADICA|nr:hypothetical protein GOP47_0019768 [Adiantum capillus-veneris]